MMIYLCAMTANSMYRKIAAALLLLCMLLTTVVQLSHSHPGKQAAAIQLKKIPVHKGIENCSVPGTDTKCFLCEYQLAKDADIDHSIFHFAAVCKAPVTAPALYEYITAVFNTCFETRGPPAATI